MKLSTMFTILAVTSLAIAKASANDVGEKHVASLLRDEEGTHQLKKKRKPQFMTMVFDVRLPLETETSLFQHGQMEVVAYCLEESGKAFRQ
jgi:hypothetical protein